MIHEFIIIITGEQRSKLLPMYVVHKTVMEKNLAGKEEHDCLFHAASCDIIFTTLILREQLMFLLYSLSAFWSDPFILKNIIFCGNCGTSKLQNNPIIYVYLFVMQNIKRRDFAGEVNFEFFIWCIELFLSFKVTQYLSKLIKAFKFYNWKRIKNSFFLFCYYFLNVFICI